MNLNIQILSVIFSFSFGIIFAYIYNLNYNFIYFTSLRYKIVINLLLVLNFFLIYFILLKNINEGVVHIYLVLIFLGGFILFYNKNIILRNKLYSIYVKLISMLKKNSEK